MTLFLSLQNAGVPAQSAIPMAFDDGEEILARLQSGMNLCEALARQPGWSLLAPLGKSLPLSDACTLVLSLRHGKRLIKKQSAAAMAYPAFILTAVWALLGFFCESVLPSMAEFLAGDSLVWIMEGLHTLLGLFLVFSVVFGLVIWLGLSGRLEISLSFVRQSHTLSLLALVGACLEARLSSLEMMQLLNSLDLDPALKAMTASMRRALVAGQDIYESLCGMPGLDPACLVYVRLGLEGLGLSRMLEMYEKKTLAAMEHQLKKVCLWLQSASYGATGLCAILVYQVLLAPMNVLSSM